MVFRKCSVAGKAYHGDSPVGTAPNPEVEAKEKAIADETHGENRSSDSTATAVQDQQAENASNPSILQAEKPKLSARFHDQDLLNDIESAVNAESGQETQARLLN